MSIGKTWPGGLALLAACALAAAGEPPAAEPAAPPEPPAAKPAALPQKPAFSFGGEVQAGFRNISADRATGNEASTYYKADLHGEARFGEELGARLRMLFRTPASERARSYELFEDLNDEFEVRELFIRYDHSALGQFRFGKFKLPFGPDDAFEDEPWNQPLLEYRIASTGTYDIGGLWERRWLDGSLRTRFSATAGNTGALDTNSALAGSGDLAWESDFFSLGAWGKLNLLDTTPIKRDDKAAGFFARFEHRNWKVLAKCAWLEQGLRTTDFNRAELEENNYGDDEIDVLLWRRDNGGESRTLRGWYLLVNAPTLRNVPVFGHRIERVDLFAHFGQLFDPRDPFEKNRERGGFGATALLQRTERARLLLSTGATFDDDTSNTRPYLDRLTDINRRNDRFTYWLKLTLKF